jgi:hypothetical protein
MSSPNVILRKHARGQYEIGIHTEDGAVVAHVSVWEGGGIDRRNEGEREKAAFEKAERLAEAFSAAMKS